MYHVTVKFNFLRHYHQITNGQVQDRFRKDDENQNFKANDESDRLRRLEEWQNVKVLQKDKKASDKIKKI